MTGYLFIIITVLLNVSKGYCSKKVSGRLDSFADNVNMNLMRNILCTMLGGLIILLSSDSGFAMPQKGRLICLVSGILLSVNYIFWLLALKTDAFMLASTANNSSFIVAAIGGMWLFAEKITVCKGIAIILIIIAIIFMTRYQAALSEKPGMRDLIILGLLLVTGGLSSITQKWFTKALPGISVHLYTFYSFAASIIFLIIYRAFLRCAKPFREQRQNLALLLPWTAVMAAALYAATFFQTKAAAVLDAVVLYPLNSALTLTASGIMAWICFKEKPNRYSIIGAIFVFAALVLSKY